VVANYLRPVLAMRAGSELDVGGGGIETGVVEGTDEEVAVFEGAGWLESCRGRVT